MDGPGDHLVNGMSYHLTLFITTKTMKASLVLYRVPFLYALQVVPTKDEGRIF